MKSAFPLLMILLVGVAQAATPEDAREGRLHLERGAARYALADFEGAIEEFKIAFELTREPALLFNLAQASRLAKKHEDALHFFRSYLRANPGATNRADAERFMDELEPLVRGAQRPVPPVAETVPSAEVPAVIHAPLPPPTPAQREVVQVVPTPSRSTRHDGRALLIAGIATAGLGAAALATGIYFGLHARSASSDLDELARTQGIWSPAAEHRFDEGGRDAQIATGLYVAGGVALGVGAILATVGAVRRSRQRFAVSPAVLPTPERAQVSCAF